MSRHVLVARQDSVGDVLLAGPAVRAVAAGAGRVTLLCGPRGRDAARLLPGVDEVVVAHASWIDAEPERVTRAAVDALVDRLTDLELDQALILTSFHQSPLPLALLLRMAGVPTIAAVSVDYPGSLLDVRHRVDEDLHEVERGLSLAATLGYRLPEGDDGRLAVRRGPGADVPELERRLRARDTESAGEIGERIELARYQLEQAYRFRYMVRNDDSGKDRALADYVMADDTAHVVLEWGRPGERDAAWITGMVLEWRERTRST